MYLFDDTQEMRRVLEDVDMEEEEERAISAVSRPLAISKTPLTEQCAGQSNTFPTKMGSEETGVGEETSLGEERPMVAAGEHGDEEEEEEEEEEALYISQSQFGLSQLSQHLLSMLGWRWGGQKVFPTYHSVLPR